MTSLAFIFGLLPLWFASGSGAVARRILGSTVIGGMIAASAIAIFLIPVAFYAVEKFASRRKSAATVPSQPAASAAPQEAVRPSLGPAVLV
jgi:HAE1 family hydrophobic/amphiphilic exporter-1